MPSHASGLLSLLKIYNDSSQGDGRFPSTSELRWIVTDVDEREVRRFLNSRIYDIGERWWDAELEKGKVSRI